MINSFILMLTFRLMSGNHRIFLLGQRRVKES